MFSFLNEWREANRLAEQRFHVIFFAESGVYFQYFEHLFENLVKIPSIKILYLTADKNDAVLQDRRITAVYLKATLAGIFPRLQADVMIMTMPDLQNFIYKRSPGVKKYVYVFHALVSTHQQYRSRAFDHYDAIFCTGPQQEREIRESEEIYGLSRKECIAYGYPLLDVLRQKMKGAIVNQKKVVVAPSWYPEGILNTCLLQLLDGIRGESRTIWVRPHPEFIKRNRKVYNQLIKEVTETGIVQIDTSTSVYTQLADAGHLVTDRSGIALEYAFASGRPVLFINTPLKIQNPDIGKFSIEPLENNYRYHLGKGILPVESYKASNVLNELERSAATFAASIQSAENAIVYPSSFGHNGLTYIRQQLTL